MSITRSAVRNITRSTVRDVVRGGDAPSGRYYTNFIASRSSYAEFNSAISVSGAYKIRIEFQREDAATMSLLGQKSLLATRVEFELNKILFRVAGTAVRTSNTISTSSELRELEIELDGNDFIFRVDGVLFDTVTNATAAAATAEFETIGQAGSARYYEGYLANLQIEENSVLIASFDMDEDSGATEFANSIDPLNNAIKVNIAADQVVFVEY